MGKLQKVYNKMPIFIQNIMTTMAGYKKNRTRYGKEYYEHLEFLNNFDKLTMKEKKEYQNSELIKFVKFAYNNSVFYNKIYSKEIINNFKGIEDLKKLPIVDKEMIRENIEDVFTIFDDYVQGHTGGTTGKSLIVRYTKKDMMKRMAVLDHFKSKVGFYNLKMKKATFNGQPIVPPKTRRKVFWRYNKASKQMIYSPFFLSEENLKYYIKSLNKFKPQAIDGFFMSILDVASYIERYNIKLTFQPIAIFPTSETITVEGRKLIEKVFRCKVYDQYASSEGAPFVTESLDGKLKVQLDTGVFETFSKENNEILVTSFTTHGTPLIRYRIGDSMTFDKNDGNTVLKIEGRKLDFLYKKDGTKISAANLSNVFKDLSNVVIRAQFIQNEIDKIILNLEIDERIFNKSHIKIIENEVYGRFGKSIKLEINVLRHIERESSGKLPFIKNEIEESII